MGDEIVTILTPTFNRAEKLHVLYKSLRRQTNKNFKWLIIDDGSTDITREFCDSIIQKKEISIEYKYKENGGKHTALNFGIPFIDTELTFIVDSDDFLTDDAIEKIYMEWKKIENKNLAGMNFLRGSDPQNPIGMKFKVDREIAEYDDMRVNRNYKYDLAEVYKTSILKRYPFPVFEGEKFIGESIVWNRIGKKYKMIYINEIIYISKYLEGGLTRSGRKLRISNPLGGLENSIVLTSKEYKLKVRVKNMMLYICYGLFAKKKLSELIKRVSSNGLFMINIIPGYFLYRYWKRKFKI